MRTFTKFALVLIVFLSTELNAQVQYGISYQAVLRDASGNVLSGKSATIRVNITNKAGTTYYYKETPQSDIIPFPVSKYLNKIGNKK